MNYYGSRTNPTTALHLLPQQGWHAGANIAARDDEYRSTPLAWATRTNAAAMVEFLIARGAPTNLPDEEPWVTPLAWADRRGHSQIASIDFSK